MATDVGKVNIEYLERPTGIAYKFMKHLAENANCVGDGNAFGFYLRKEVEQEAKDFVSRANASPDQAAEVNQWVESLPWDDTGYLALTFNW